MVTQTEEGGLEVETVVSSSHHSLSVDGGDDATAVSTKEALLDDGVTAVSF